MSEIQQGRSCSFHNAESLKSQMAAPSLYLDSPPVNGVVSLSAHPQGWRRPSGASW